MTLLFLFSINFSNETKLIQPNTQPKKPQILLTFYQLQVIVGLNKAVEIIKLQMTYFVVRTICV